MKIAKHLIAFVLAWFFLAVLMTGCHCVIHRHIERPAPIYVSVAPPPVKHEAKPPSPAPGHIWVAGHWDWNEADGEWEWQEGTWEEPPDQGMKWRAPAYEERDDDWVYIPGYWAGEDEGIGGPDRYRAPPVQPESGSGGGDSESGGQAEQPEPTPPAGGGGDPGDPAEEPEVSDDPGHPGKKGKGPHPATPATPAKPGRYGKPATPATPAQPGGGGAHDQGGKAGKPSKGHGGGKAGKPPKGHGGGKAGQPSGHGAGKPPKPADRGQGRANKSDKGGKKKGKCTTNKHCNCDGVCDSKENKGCGDCKKP